MSFNGGGGGITEGAADLLYLRLDTTNDPLTNNLAITGSITATSSISGTNITGTGSLQIGNDTAPFTFVDNIFNDLNIGSASFNHDLTVFGDSTVTGDALIDGNLRLALGFATGGVLFTNASDQVAQDDANFHYDDVNNRLGLLENVPLRTLHVGGTSGILVETARDFRYSYDTQVRSIVTADVLQDVIFDTNGANAGTDITHTAGTAIFTFTTGGTYIFDYTFTVQKTAGGSSTAEFVLFKDTGGGFVQQPGTSVSEEITSNNQPITMGRSVTLGVGAGDIIKVQFAGNTTQTQLVPGGDTVATKLSASINIGRRI